MSVADVLRQQRPGAQPNSFFDRIGGRETLERVHARFYEKVYSHPWIGKYFAHVEREHIETMQSDFMTGQFDGGRIFCGRPPTLAHVHIAVTEELFDLRQSLLREALVEEGIAEVDREYWLQVDEKFRRVLLRDVSDCRPIAQETGVLDFPDPGTGRREEPRPPLPHSRESQGIRRSRSRSAGPPR